MHAVNSVCKRGNRTTSWEGDVYPEVDSIAPAHCRDSVHVVYDCDITVQQCISSSTVIGSTRPARKDTIESKVQAPVART